MLETLDKIACEWLLLVALTAFLAWAVLELFGTAMVPTLLWSAGCVLAAAVAVRTTYRIRGYLR